MLRFPMHKHDMSLPAHERSGEQSCTLPFKAHSLGLKATVPCVIPACRTAGSVAAILQAEVTCSIAAFTLGLAVLASADQPLAFFACSSQPTSVSSPPTFS